MPKLIETLEYAADRVLCDLGKAHYEGTSRLTEEISVWPKRTYDGGAALELSPCGGGKLVLGFPVLREGRDVLSLSVNGGRNGVLLLRLVFAEGTQEAELHFFDNRWNRILLDISDCGQQLLRAEIVPVTREREPYPDVLYLGEFYLGKILDLTFRRGNAAPFFSPSSCVSHEDGALLFRFEEGEKLLFPEFPHARYSVLHALLSQKDTVKISAEARGCMRYRLWFKTNLQPFSEERTAVISFRGKGVVSALARIGEFCISDKERLEGLLLEPLSKRGSLLLREVSFVQEKDIILDDVALNFVHKRPTAVRDPYAFPRPKAYFDVRDYGARGDFYTDDTAAIRAAISAAEKQGGGVVVLKDGYFVATHIVLGSDIELRILPSAVLVQDFRAEDYPYPVRYGHDDFFCKVNWGHNFLVNNRPLIYAEGAERVRVCGGGRIRMCDAGSEALMGGYPYYDIHCGGIPHVVPMGFLCCKGVKVDNITVTRANSYHLFLCRCERVFLNRLKFIDPRCLSGDGVAVCGTKKVLFANSMIVSNDDGVTLNPLYFDPRAGGWWKCAPGENNTVEEIEISHCYINSGYGGWGKAISFIPWAKGAPNQEFARIREIFVHDCILKGGHSVGTWSDDPYHGKQPYDGSEKDDYSPVMDLRFFRNTYMGKADLEEIAVTNLVGDSGLRAAQFIVNGDFHDGMCHWKGEGKLSDGAVLLGRGQSLYEIIRSSAGKNVFRFELQGEGVLFAGGARREFSLPERGYLEISVSFRSEHNFKVGVTAAADTTVFGVEKV